ncbi:DUF418 domain-containing protein [Kribbella jejuensis]|uniref:Putative membrane protein YeiB n=1 Tax=Kribbella jejuensis TaxID=236068 RepID=A0A542DA41_9ACTN|nr:DUF418 domain-containing protein [Kribbella jejuensis]TQI99926.1 putative membrane protein YeiB [Kribbella jejuensis]
MTTTLATPKSDHRGPVTGRERALAPDLIRGAMLLLIGLANSANFAFAGQPGVESAPHGFERILNFLKLTFVDARAYPVFAVMFGYGLVQLARRQRSAGASTSAVRRVLVKRNAWLIGFGLAHATLLYFGDFLGAYGVVGIVCTLVLINRGDKFHRIVLALWAFMGLETLFVAAKAVASIIGSTGPAHALTNSPNPSLAATSYVGSLVGRLHEYPLHLASVLPFIIIVWLGIWAARKQLLENPAAHKTLLTRVAAVCLGLTFVGGLPLALIGAGWIHVDQAAVDSASLLSHVSGMFGGPGYVALFGLLVARIRKQSLPVRAISALGQRSLSGYLFQSVAWMALLAPFTLDLRFGSTAYTAALVAIGVWIVSVLGAYAMSKRSYRGPAETLLRRLVY